MSKIQLICVISSLSFSVIIGTLVFSRGFLLNRQIVVDKSDPCWSHLGTIKDSGTGTPDGHPHGRTGASLTSEHYEPSAKWCNPSSPFTKVIFILVDALRFDFISRMKFLSQIVESSNEISRSQDQISSCAFKFIADPPTTTMQRLKALMTGTMPTFIDASANFNRQVFEVNPSVICIIYENLSIVN